MSSNLSFIFPDIKLLDQEPIGIEIFEKSLSIGISSYRVRILVQFASKSDWWTSSQKESNAHDNDFVGIILTGKFESELCLLEMVLVGHESMKSQFSKKMELIFELYD